MFFCQENKSVPEIVSIMNNELSKIVIWLRANRLSLNVKKTHFMIFHSGRKKVDNLQQGISIDGIEVESVESTKFIGVLLDSKLSWAQHIQMVKGKIARGIGIINKARKSLSMPTLVTLYNSIVYPHLIYCIETWGSAAQIYINSLFKVQKKCVRIIKSVSYRANSIPIFKDLKILPLEYIYKSRMLIFMYKFTKGMLPTVFDDIFVKHTPIYRTRQFFNLKIQKCKTTLFQKTLRFQGVNEWNSIHCKIDINCSIHTFKKRIKLYLLNEM
jgi:hypothetical protein